MSAALVSVTLALLAATARAEGWYYKWSCSGRCAPGQLAIKGVEGPFSSETTCDAARGSDPRAREFVAEGNLGGLEFCEYMTEAEAEAARGESSGPRLPVRVRLAAAASSGWTLERLGASTEANTTAGAEAEFRAGGSKFGIEVVLGLHRLPVAGAFFDGADETIWMAPLLIGISSSPVQLLHAGGVRLRAELGVDGGYILPFGCPGDCEYGLASGLGWRAHGGLELYWGDGARHGIGLDLVIPRHTLGELTADAAPTDVEIQSPTWIARLSFLRWNWPHERR